MPGFLLHLAGPMQSWADTGFGQLRGAGAFPSRAAVLGVVAAAEGVPRGDARLVALHDVFRVHVATVRPGQVFRDFHTVETKPGENRTLTSRDYHHDAHFVALVEGDDADEVGQAVAALRAPTFTSFLGRRSCPPAVPLLPFPAENGIASLVEAATEARQDVPVTGERRQPRPRGADAPVTVYLDGPLDLLPPVFAGARHTATYGTRRDRLVAPRRSYADRPFTQVQITPSDVPQ